MRAGGLHGQPVDIGAKLLDLGRQLVTLPGQFDNGGVRGARHGLGRRRRRGQPVVPQSEDQGGHRDAPGQREQQPESGARAVRPEGRLGEPRNRKLHLWIGRIHGRRGLNLALRFRRHGNRLQLEHPVAGLPPQGPVRLAEEEARAGRPQLVGSYHQRYLPGFGEVPVEYLQVGVAQANIAPGMRVIPSHHRGPGRAGLRSKGSNLHAQGCFIPGGESERRAESVLASHGPRIQYAHRAAVPHSQQQPADLQPSPGQPVQSFHGGAAHRFHHGTGKLDGAGRVLHPPANPLPCAGFRHVRPIL